MNDKCKYCDYVSKCSRICEYNSYLCKVHRSFPKVVDKSYEQLQQENKILKENAENNDKVVDKVNWKNMLLKKENKQLKIQISAREEVCNRLESNWNKLRDYFNERIEVCDNRLSSPFCNFEKVTKERLIFSQCLEKLEELKQGSDSNEI